MTRWIRPCRIAVFCLLLGTPAALAESATPAKDKAPPCQSAGESTTLHLGCAALPNIPPVKVEIKESTSGSGLKTTIKRSYELHAFPQPDYDYFAWNSFAALNWPALVPEENGYQRGFPDTSQSFVDAHPKALTTWETLKEKREVFFYNPDKTALEIPDPGPWNGPVNYLGPESDAPWCPGYPKSSKGLERTLAQVDKGFFDSLDETIEVSSEALEDPDLLCQGHTKTPCACSADDTLTCLTDKPAKCCFKKTQSACCNVYGQAVAPRVWKKTSGGKAPRPVYYEVKVNYDFYDYVQQNRYYLDSVKDADLKRKGGPFIKLPYRSNDSLPPNGNRTVLNSSGRVLDYSSQACAQLISEVNAFPGLHSGTDGNFLPCRVGAVHLKAAWIRLTEDEIASGKFHMRDSAFFATENKALCRKEATFGLVGLHIIQRTHPTLPDGTPPMARVATLKKADGSTEEKILEPAISAKAVGGAFVFATWEHTEISPDDTKPSPDYVFSNYYPGLIAGLEPSKKVQVPDAKTFYPALDSALPVQRALGRQGILDNTRKANQEVWKELGCDSDPSPSVWCNYQLVGVQAMPINVDDKPEAKAPFKPNANDPTGIGQPLYLANLVIETNHGLQKFQGLPPNTDKGGIDDFKGSGIRENAAPAFARDLSNITFGQYQLVGKYGPGFTPIPYNMGGCLGCHGVSMLQGASFSFVLQDGQAGAAISTEEHFDIAPAPIRSSPD